MAPIKPGKRNNIRARANKSLDPRGKYAPPLHPVEDASPEEQPSPILKPAEETRNPGMQDAEWRLNKQDKRAIKHNALLNKVREAGVTKQKKVLKRRRPGKKLAGGDLGDLADALPETEEMEVEEEDDDGEEWEGVDEEMNGEEGAAVVKKPRRKRRKVPVGGRMEMKSLSMRQGAMRRKAEMEGKEKERFGRNLAKMVQGVGPNGTEGAGGVEGGQAARWAALRAFIGGTMQTNEAFKKA